jgi:hypothetical protein
MAPPATTRIAPLWETTNSRPDPSRALTTPIGEGIPPRTFSSATDGGHGGGGAGVFVGVAVNVGTGAGGPPDWRAVGLQPAAIANATVSAAPQNRRTLAVTLPAAFLVGF